MSFFSIRNPRLAFAVAAFIGCVWLNQGPSMRCYEALSRQADASPLVRAWMPFAFAYRRSADEELYFAIANAIRGAPFDEALLLAKRGETPRDFAHFPPADGHWHVPYGEVPFEYPALVLPFILLPASWAPTFGVFAVGFGLLMAALMLASVHLVVRANPFVPAEERAAAWWLAAALFLAQGGLLVQRIDAVPTVLLSVALWAAVRRKAALLGLGIGLAAAAKVVPVLVLLPLMVADRETFRSARAIGSVAAGVAAGLALGVLPMVLLSPSGLVAFVRFHGGRGLQVESTFGVVLAIVELFRGGVEAATLSFGSYNLAGAVASALATASTLLLVVSNLALVTWLATRRGTATDAARRRTLACAGLAALVFVWLFAKVFSPQYMTWAIPFALLAGDKRIQGLLVLAMAITQTYLRGFYDAVVEMRPFAVGVLAFRLGLLVAVAVLLVRALAAFTASGQGPVAYAGAVRRSKPPLP